MKVSSDSINWKYARVFLDTSALLKLLAPELEEPGTRDLESYLKPGLGISIQTGNYCIGEVLGILKRKLNSKSERESNTKQNKPNITADGYLIVIKRLNWKLDNKGLKIYDLPLSQYYNESIAFVKKYDIDYVDALILNHLMRSNDYDLFVTDDRKLKTAADECKVLCWYLRDTCPQA